jgi:hypothetical protein
MSNKFDELAKGLAQSVTRRQALKRFGVGLAAMALACFGLANKAEAHKQCLPLGSGCNDGSDCCSGICCLGGSGRHHAVCQSNDLFCF